MSDFLKWIDNTLGTNFDAPQYNPKAGRAKMVKVIDTALAQRSEGKTPPTRSWRTGNQNAVSFTPKVNGNPVLIEGAETNYVPAEHFEAFLTGLKQFVQDGKLDDEIKAAMEGKVKASGTKRSAGATRSRGGDKPWQSRSDWASLDVGSKRSIGKYYSQGKNPDGTSIADVGHQPDAKIVKAK